VYGDAGKGRGQSHEMDNGWGEIRRGGRRVGDLALSLIPF
jgi:hypothetical protein